MESQWERLLKSQGYLQHLKIKIWFGEFLHVQPSVGRQPLTLSVRDICSVLHTPRAHESHWTDRHSLLDGIPCRKNSSRSLLHLITRHQLGSGLQLRTWLTNKDVSFTSNWPNGMVRRRALNPSAFTARHVQQRQLQNKKQKKLPFTARTKIPIEMLSTVKQNFTSARSCKSAKWICSFFSKGTRIQWFRNYYTTTGTAVVCRMKHLSGLPLVQCYLCLSACAKDSLQQWQQRMVLLPVQKNTIT